MVLDKGIYVRTYFYNTEIRAELYSYSFLLCVMRPFNE